MTRSLSGLSEPPISPRFLSHPLLSEGLGEAPSFQYLGSFFSELAPFSLLKVIQEGGDTFQSGFTFTLYFNLELDTCLTDTTQIVDRIE